MSRHSSHERSVTIGDAEFLSIIREEQCSPAMSSVNINDITKRPCSKSNSASKCCTCKTEQVMLENDELSNILAEKEVQLRNEYDKKYEEQMQMLRERFDFILQNEQVRTSHMLREAHRERQEKITALQNQLECKNMAALMYVLSSERRKSRLEKLRIVEEYTNHITALQTILGEGQGLILDLSRGYKTAAKIDHEWRIKMTKVVGEFQNFIHAFAGGEETCNQYFFDLPALLKTEASLQDDPTEDPCISEEASVEEEEALPTPENTTKGAWWERLQAECRPFVVFGDMSEFKPPQRRAVLKVVKASKTAPKKWKEYVFNEMFLQADCANLNIIKDEYHHHLPTPSLWECRDETTSKNQSGSVSRRVTPPSLETRTNMGSILKLITAPIGARAPHQQHRATILGARDSMEIASSTKILREKRISSRGDGKVILNIRNRTASIFQDDEDDDDEVDKPQTIIPPPKEPKLVEEQEEEEQESVSRLGSIHHDSLEVLQYHVPDKDAKINYEKVCPMEACKRMKMDSFVRSLPPYMRANPFTHFEQDFEGYEACSPEQLKILKERIEMKKKKQHIEVVADPDPLEEWKAFKDVGGVGVQTSVDSMFPPCTCAAPSPTPASSVSNDYGHVYTMEELIPVKRMLDQVQQDCLYNSDIEFDRFKVIGQQNEHETKSKGDYGRSKFEEIKRILKQHPSLCDIFQGSAQC